MRHSCEQTPTCEANPYAPYRPLHRNHPSACAHRRSARRLLKPNTAARISADDRARSCANHCAPAYYRACARSPNNSARAYGNSHRTHYSACAYHCARTYGRPHCAYDSARADDRAARRIRIGRACVHA